MKGDGGRPDDERGVGDTGGVRGAGAGRRGGHLDSSSAETRTVTVGVVDEIDGHMHLRGLQELKTSNTSNQTSQTITSDHRLQLETTSSEIIQAASPPFPAPSPLHPLSTPSLFFL